MKLQEKDDAASAFVSASKAYKKTSPEAAIQALQKAVEIYTDKGRFHAAANHEKTIAEVYESDLGDLEGAMNAYQTAADWYQSEEANAYVSFINSRFVVWQIIACSRLLLLRHNFHNTIWPIPSLNKLLLLKWTTISQNGASENIYSKLDCVDWPVVIWKALERLWNVMMLWTFPLPRLEKANF